jgi:DNA-binding NarL/FixJ family response regulator
MRDDGAIDVLLADDQTLVRDGFRALIDREPDMRVVAEAADGVEAIALTRRHSPDVVLMDIRMPHIDGLTATTRVLALPQPPRVLVLTTFDRNEWVYDALRAGASGFLLKDVRGGQLTDAIRTVAAGESLLAPSITRRLIEQFVARQPAARPQPPPGVLTEREAEVLRLLAAGLSNAEIADRLVIGHSTVKTHVTRLLTKLDLRDRAQAVVYAYETGFVQAGGPSPA